MASGSNQCLDAAYQCAFASHARLAELSFRGVDFTELSREVVKHIDTVCGAMAKQLASLFAFLKERSGGGVGNEGRGTSALC